MCLGWWVENGEMGKNHLAGTLRVLGEPGSDRKRIGQGRLARKYVWVEISKLIDINSAEGGVGMVVQNERHSRQRKIWESWSWVHNLSLPLWRPIPLHASVSPNVIRRAGLSGFLKSSIQMGILFDHTVHYFPFPLPSGVLPLLLCAFSLSFLLWPFSAPSLLFLVMWPVTKGSREYYFIYLRTRWAEGVADCFINIYSQIWIGRIKILDTE